MGRYYYGGSPLFDAGNLDIDDAMPNITTEEASAVEMAENNLKAIQSEDVGEEIENDIALTEMAVDTFGAVNTEHQKHIENIDKMEVEGVDENVVAAESMKLSAMISEAAGVLSIPLESKHVSGVYNSGLLAIAKPTLENYREGVLGVGDFLKKIKDKIVSFFKMIWDKIKQFWNWLFGSKKVEAESSEAAAALEKATEDVEKLPESEKAEVKEKVKKELPEALDMKDPKVAAVLKLLSEGKNPVTLIDELNQLISESSAVLQEEKKKIQQETLDAAKRLSGFGGKEVMSEIGAKKIQALEFELNGHKKLAEDIQAGFAALEKSNKALEKLYSSCVRNKLRISDLGLAVKAEGVELPGRENMVYLPGHDNTILCKFDMSGKAVYSYVRNVQVFAMEETSVTCDRFVELIIFGKDKGKGQIGLQDYANKVKGVLNKLKALSQADMQRMTANQKEFEKFINTLNPDMSKGVSKELAGLLKTHMVLMGDSYKELKADYSFLSTLNRVYKTSAAAVNQAFKDDKEEVKSA